MASMDRLDRWAPAALAILRIVTGLIFLEHGAQKLFGFPPAANPMPLAFSLFWFGGVLEFAGGSLILIGFLTRPVAFVLAGEMAVAYWMMHARISPFPTINNGDAAVLFCFIFLFFSAAGGGPWSVDRLLRRRDGEMGI